MTLYQAQAQCGVHLEPGFNPAFLSRTVIVGAHSCRLPAFLYDNSPQTHYNQSLRISWSMVRFIEYRQENQYQLGLPWSCINMESKPCRPWASCSQPDTQTLLDAVFQGQLEDPHCPDLPVFVAPQNLPFLFEMLFVVAHGCSRKRRARFRVPKGPPHEKHHFHV